MSVTIPDKIRFNADGLIPAVIQDVESGSVLMLAYMNRESLARSLATGETWFYSRSRRELWHKGATSGHRQYIVNASYDCDADALLFQVRQEGVACHEGEFSCFHNPLPLQISRPRSRGEAGGRPHGAEGAGVNTPDLAAGAPREDWNPEREKRDETGKGAAGRAGQGPLSGPEDTGVPDAPGNRPPARPSPTLALAGGSTLTAAGPGLGDVLDEVFRVIKERQATRPQGSYTTRLFNDGQDKILKKIGEEAGETIIASKNDSRREILYEMADLYYHTLVLLAYHGLEPADLAAELAARR